MDVGGKKNINKNSSGGWVGRDGLGGKDIGGQAPSAHGRGSTFFSARGGSIFSKQGGVRGGVPWKKNPSNF